MTHRLSSALALLCVVSIPMDGRADDFTLSDVTMTAFTSFESQRIPLIEDFDSTVAPRTGNLAAAQALVRAGQPFPNVDNSVGSGFASSTATASGVFGVGVNGFFLQNSLPPNEFVASGTWTQTLTNTSNETLPVFGTFLIPAPKISFFGVGNSFPQGANPDLDASARVELRILSTLRRPNELENRVHLNYGMQTVRNPVGELIALPLADAQGLIRRFDEPGGGFSFELPFLTLVDFIFPDLAPGESLDFGYDFIATASTGFGETGVLALIGDPFTLSGGSPFEIRVGGAVPPVTPLPPSTSVPEPATLTLLGLGCLALRPLIARRRV
jgi:hypothetical protein